MATCERCGSPKAGATTLNVHVTNISTGLHSIEPAQFTLCLFCSWVGQTREPLESWGAFLAERHGVKAHETPKEPPRE